MRSIPMVLSLVLAGLLFPRTVEAVTCDDDLLACYTSTILFATPEEYDLIGCQLEYLDCMARLLRFA